MALRLSDVEYRDDFFGDDLAYYDDGRTSGPLADWMRDVLIQALIDEGCPRDVAPGLVQHANLRTGEGRTWQLDVHTATYWLFALRRDAGAEIGVQAALRAALARRIRAR